MTTEVRDELAQPPARTAAYGMPRACPRALWAQQVFIAVVELRGRVSLVPELTASEIDRELLARVLELTGAALDLLADQPRLLGFGRLVEWWTGSRVEACWAYLHEAELAVVALARDPERLPAVLAHTLTYAARLDPDDPDRRLLEDIANVGRRGAR